MNEVNYPAVGRKGDVQRMIAVTYGFFHLQVEVDEKETHIFNRDRGQINFFAKPIQCFGDHASIQCLDIVSQFIFIFIQCGRIGNKKTACLLLQLMITEGVLIRIAVKTHFQKMKSFLIGHGNILRPVNNRAVGNKKAVQRRSFLRLYFPFESFYEFRKTTDGKISLQQDDFIMIDG